VSSSHRRSHPQKIAEVAQGLFVRYGLRRTSMDDVAKAAKVAKGTVYLAFASKEALFRAVCERLCRDLLEQIDQVVGQSLEPRQRIVSRLLTKYLALHRLVYSSPHAAELLSSKDSVAGDVLLHMDQTFVNALAGDVRAAFVSLSAEASQRVARMLMRLARSCSFADEGEAVPTERVVEKRLRVAIETMLTGVETKPSIY
jgi:AcrR family transcriptional regulator